MAHTIAWRLKGWRRPPQRHEAPDRGVDGAAGQAGRL